MNIGSRIRLITAPSITVIIPFWGYPCALIKPLSPVDSTENIVPRRYILRYWSAYTYVSSLAPKRKSTGLLKM